jgi:rhombotail lipoprotein
MKVISSICALFITVALAGCTLVHSQSHKSSSLVSFLYPDGATPPPNNTIPELRVPLRVGLAFLPSQGSYGAAQLEATQKQELLERIRQRFSSRRFVSEIVVIPDYYIANARGFGGLEGMQRLYNIDLMALVSYDQVTHRDDNKLSLGYLTIVGAYILPGSSHDTATLVDLAVVDPVTRSLVLRAGGTNTRHGASTLIAVDRDSRKDSMASFADATSQMIGNFDVALTAFEADVQAGKANVRVVARNGQGGGGAVGTWEVLALLLAAAARRTWGRAVTVRMPVGR